MTSKILIISDSPRDAAMLLANHGSRADAAILLANNFTVLQDDWVQLVPFGDYPHSGPVDNEGKPIKAVGGRPKYPRGVVQRLDNAAGDIIVNQFNSIASRVGRLFGGLPWYIGHPDLDRERYPDDSAYGWIMKLENRDDGLYGQVKWNDEGEQIKKSAKYKYFSPLFDRAEDTNLHLDNGRAVLRPTMLKSVGFVNDPNIPVMPLANEARHDLMKEATKENLANSYIDDAIEDGVLIETDRDEWLGYFREDYKTARQCLGNGTSDGVRKAWVTRRANMAASAEKMPKAAAKVAAKTMKKSRSDAARTKHQAVIDKVEKQGGKHSSPEEKKAHATAKKYFASSKRRAGVGEHEPKQLKISLPKTDGGQVIDGKVSAESEAKLARMKSSMEASLKKPTPPPLPKPATPPPLPKAATPPPLPPLKPAAVTRQNLTTRFPGGQAVPFVAAAAHQIKYGHNPFF